MYPIFESKWLVTSSKLKHDFYTIVKKMKFCTRPYKLQLLNIHDFDKVRSPKWPTKKSFYIAIAFRVRQPKGVRAYPIFEYKWPLCFLDCGIIFTPLWRKWNSASDYRNCSLPMLLTSIQWDRLHGQREGAFTLFFFYSDSRVSRAFAQSGNA